MSSTSGEFQLALRSEPRWLTGGLAALSVASLGGFVAVFHFLGVRSPLVWSGAIPGVTLATFGGAALAWWGRRRGGTVQLLPQNGELNLRESSGTRRVLAPGGAYGALLLVATDGPTRALVLTQGLEQTVVLGLEDGAEPGPEWESHTVRLALAGVPLSPATAGVVTTALGQPLAPLLGYLEKHELGRASLVHLRLDNGELLDLSRTADGLELRLGERVLAPSEKVAARRLTIDTEQGPVLGLSLIGEHLSLLLASEDPAGSEEGGPAAEAPDAFLSPALFAAVCQLFGVAPAEHGATTRQYKP